MRILHRTLVLTLLSCGLILSVASGWDGGNVTITEEHRPRVDETWLVENLYDGQTDVDPRTTIRLTLGHQDFDDWPARQALENARLYRQRDGRSVSFRVTVQWDRSELEPMEALEPDTDYVLDLDFVQDDLSSIRVDSPPVHFSTRPGPRVLGLWRNGDTLLIEFSEDMDPETLYVGHDSVDVLWEVDGELETIASHHNLAGYVWDVQGPLFLVAPIAFADEIGPVWVKVSGAVRGRSAVPLDGDGDGSPGEVTDDFFEEVHPAGLSACFTREDIPHPCIEEGDVPHLTNQGW